MKQHLTELLTAAINKLKMEQGLSVPDSYSVQIERTRDNQHGEYASNIAMLLTKATGLKPRDLASEIVSQIPESEFVDKIEIAGPGFINFFLNQKAHVQVVNDIQQEKENYGHNSKGEGISVLVEFVSANPTGPLHIGHGRGAAYGAAVANLLDACGHHVVREYYVNDAGRQMDILAISVWLRYLQRCGHEYSFPEKAYQADYVIKIADDLLREHGDIFNVSLSGLITDNWQDMDPEMQLDKLIAFAKQHLGDEKYATLHETGLNEIVDDIRNDLETFGVTFDNWYSEKSLTSNKLIDTCIEKLTASGDIYEEAGAKWFDSTKYGDEKNRVVERDNGNKTYFAADIAYHKDKFDRGFNKLINVWGADHHGYISRVKGALTALGKEADDLIILLVQFATLYRGKEKIQMSTRSGEYVTLEDLYNEVGRDAARFFYVTRKSEQHLDFDLELAKSQSNDNPVYYIQYAHARICSVLQQMRDKNYQYRKEKASQSLYHLTQEHEQALLRTLARYPEVVLNASEKYEPHQIGFYLRDLATDFHAYYNTHQFLVDDDDIRTARISLILATRQVIQNGLKILGVSAPEKM